MSIGGSAFSSGDDVAFHIELDALQAIQTMKDLNAQATSFGEKIDNVTEVIQVAADKWGVSFNNAAISLQEVDAAMAKTGQTASVFGDQASMGWREVKNSADEAGGSFNVINTILGTLTAVLVFQVLQAIQQTFTQAIDLANQYYDALFKINTAQDVMAKGGIQTSQQNLIDMAKQLSDQFGVFSNSEMLEAVGNAALLTREFGFTQDQVKGVVQAASALAIQNNDIANLSNYIEQITRGLTSGTFPASISKLGIDVKASSLEIKAMEESLYGTTKGLSDQQTALASYSVMMEHMNDIMDKFSGYQKTLPGQEEALGASWADLLTQAGTTFAPILEMLIKVANTALQLLSIFQSFSEFMVSKFAAAFVVAYEAMQGHIKSVQDLEDTYNKASADISNKIDILVGKVTDLSNSADTGTVSIDKYAAALAKVQGTPIDLSSLEKSIESINDQMTQLTDKFNISQDRAQEDFNTSQTRKLQDYQNSVAQTITDYNNKRADIEQKYRDNEIIAEEKYQQQLDALREKYLFDLEGALRARDATQVLRLQEQYKMNQDNLQDEEELRKKTDATNLQEQLTAAKTAEDQKLQQEAASFKLDQQRAEEDFKTKQDRAAQDYQDQLDQLKANEDAKIKEEADALGQQFDLNQQGVDAIYKMLESYYGPNGQFDQLYKYSSDSAVATAKFIAQMMQTIAQQIAGASKVSGTGSGTVGTPQPQDGATGGGSNRRASGGLDIANSPTTLTFGEAGPEAHLFIPLDGSSSLPSSISNLGGSGGKVGIEITLSPDLEHRITENTLSKTGDIITKVRRSNK
jgi:hypothetical protein